MFETAIAALLLTLIGALVRAVLKVAEPGSPVSFGAPLVLGRLSYGDDERTIVN